MRMEKMFKGAGELTNEVTLPEADVMRFVKMDKPEFAGKAATEASLKVQHIYMQYIRLLLETRMH